MVLGALLWWKKSTCYRYTRFSLLNVASVWVLVSTESICQFEFRFRYRTETKKVVSVGHYSDANSELWRPRFAMVASKLWIWRETWTRWICKWQNAFLHAFITANKTEKAFRFICCAMNDKSWKLQFKNEFYTWIISYSKRTAWIWITKWPIDQA